MIQTQLLFPGQTCTVFLETKDSDGYRADCVDLPVIDRIILPSLTLAGDYPAAMTKIDTGLYLHQFAIPTGASAVGSYLVDASYYHPTTEQFETALFQILVQAPFGNYGATTF